MAKEDIQVRYDSDEDLLSLFKKDSSVKFSFTIILPNGDIVVDYDFSGLIVGIEFFNASSYFPFLLESLDFSKIKASMSVQYGPNWANISYALYLPHLDKPIIQFINAPYNKRLILEH